MKQRFYYLSVITFVVFTMACGTKTDAPTSSELSAEIIPVKIAPVHTNPSSSAITATGLITTSNEARYAFKIGGIIEKIYVNEGAFFKKGQALASLKITEINAQLSQASLALEKAKRDYTRTAILYNDSVYTLEQLQNAKTGLDIAGKTVEAVAFNKKYAYIFANADGFVGKKLASEGEVANAGTPIFAINETSGTADWTLKIGVTDKQWAAIQTGTKATVTIDAFADTTITGTVFRKSQTSDQSSGSFQVELKLDLAGLKPAVGMFAKASIDAGNEAQLPVIPYDALIEADGNSAFVFVPSGSHSVRKIPIVIESFNNNDVVVKSGLEHVTAIVVSNSAFLNNKSRVSIIK